MFHDGAAWLVAGSGLAFFDGQRFHTERLEVAGRGAQATALFSSGPDDIWGVGRDLIHYDGVAWTVIEADVGLNDIAGAGADDIWAVGDSGVVRHFDGLGWNDVDAGFSGDLRTVHVDSLGRAVVGGFNDVLRRDGSGFSVVAHFNAGSDRGMALSDDNGELFVVQRQRLFRESSGFTTPALLQLARGNAADLLVRSSTEAWFVGSSGAQRYDGVTFVEARIDGNSLIDTPRAPFRLAADGDDLFVTAFGGRIFALDGADFDREVTPRVQNAPPFGSVSAVDDDGGFSLWALRGVGELWRRRNGEAWERLDDRLDFGADEIIAVSADEAWLRGSTRTGHWRDGTMTVTTDVVSGGCAVGDSAWALQSTGNLTRLSPAGIVIEGVPPNLGESVLCPGGGDVWIDGILGLARRRADGGFDMVGVGATGPIWSLGDQVRMPLGFGREVHLDVTGSRTVVGPEVIRYAGLSSADHWRIERDALVHVRDGAEHRASLSPGFFLADAAVLGDAIYLVIDNGVTRYAEADGFSQIGDGVGVQRLVLTSPDDGIALGFDGLLRWDGVSFRDFAPDLAGVSIVSFDRADDGDVWVSDVVFATGRAELVHLDSDGAVVERFADVGGAIVARADDDVWATFPQLRHFDGLGFVDVDISGFQSLARLDDGVVASGFSDFNQQHAIVTVANANGSRRVPILSPLLWSALDADGSFVFVDELLQAVRVIGNEMQPMPLDEASLVLAGRAAIGVGSDGAARLQELRGIDVVDADTTFPIDPARLQTTPAGVQLVRTQSGGLLSRRPR
ncbi:MAG: hypothetical protein Q8O67_28965 [Deltaproteobacteria bacterium]|nr:hypothetical protein [Deltaproteobacteria bacterium]